MAPMDWVHNNRNKSAQSNLERKPRRGAVAYVRRKVPIGYNGAPKFPPKVSLPVDRSQNPTICLILGPVRSTMPNGIRIRSAVFPQCTGQTDASTYARNVTYVRTERPRDRPRESLTTIGRYATRATRPKTYFIVSRVFNV